MKLTKYFTRVAAALEAEARAEILHDVQHGDLSDQALAIESQRDGAAELAVATVESLHSARRLDNDVTELCELESHALAVRDTIELVNTNGGFTAESMGWANLAIHSVLGHVVDESPRLSASTEAFAEGRQVLSLEGLDQVIQTIGEVRADVEAKSVDAILRVFDVLKDAMPEVKNRLIALQQALPNTAYDEDKDIRLDDLVFKSLAVDGVIPASLGSYLGTYAEFANCILSAYSENALESASKTPMVAEAIAKLGDSCPIKALACVYREIGDPRSGISADQLCFSLPGSGPLFGNRVDPLADGGADGAETVATEDMNEDVGTDDLIQRLQQYCTNRAPLDPLSYADRADADGENPTIRVLSKDSIGKGLCELIKAFEVVDIKTFAEARRQTWVQSRSAYGAFQKELINIQPSQVAALRPVCPALADYLDMVFALSAWPALHLLTNLVFTANGFLLLAERSIAGKTEEAPVVASDEPADEIVDPTADATDATPAEPIAADETVVVDDTAPPAAEPEVDAEAGTDVTETPEGVVVDAPEGVDVHVDVTDDKGGEDAGGEPEASVPTDDAAAADEGGETPPEAAEPPAEEPAVPEEEEEEENEDEEEPLL